MGSTEPLARADESPVHWVRVDEFWMDETEVTNAQFEAFVEATGYVTVAERPIDWESIRTQYPPGTPRPDDESLRPGSLVFTPPDHPVELDRFDQWWTWTPGASWRSPSGPGSDIRGRESHPVVHIAWEDAAAYAAWCNKRLPTEAEWEFAALGGQRSAQDDAGGGSSRSAEFNIWQGRFPYLNTAEDGFVGSAPVRSFEANGFGLHDMAGNVWEWCIDVYRPDTYANRADSALTASTAIDNPAFAGRDHGGQVRVRRVLRGGSYLCNDSYCASYRPSARMGADPDSGASHIGFRCVSPSTTPPP